ncbi:TPA: hypothetical protein L5650_003610 [Pseudomonas aeruginosa]|nr:hypothetical protein AM489_21090 [Pseudomonas aeruginosa]AWT30505.1 hypothetical protein DCS61_15945 [Pseudomonas aeruginosa]AXZ90109.1 hypothetical protein AM490_05680 [Pseudomonas aeruginosa]KAB0706802.1 hypothetical protein F7O86_24005 [Pseudomonas aeruginosa]MBY5274024.1 hypothetical protein [Pseudomonas aeruginosa]
MRLSKPPRSFVDRGGFRGILPLNPLHDDSARPPDGADRSVGYFSGRGRANHAQRDSQDGAELPSAERRRFGKKPCFMWFL